MQEPYQYSIDNLMQITKFESPMCKLELIYLSCTQEISKQLEEYWHGYAWPSKNFLLIDIDNLQGILIYIISRLHYPQIWSEILIMEEFLPETVQMSNRNFYLMLIKASCEFLI